MDEATKRIRERVSIEPDHVDNVASSDYPGAYPGQDDAWDLDKFKKNMRIDVASVSDELVEFDLVGVDAAIANTLRRILIAEVPTMAIEHVYIQKNTSIIPDEVLAHRLGLVPILADATLFEAHRAGSSEFTDEDTIVLELRVKCTVNRDAPPDATDPNVRYKNTKVLSSALKWSPAGNQAERFKDNPIRPVHNDILLAKLRPGQEINVDIHCTKGIGKVHAKWSPVGTASYRLMPAITLLEPVRGEKAKRLAKCFAKGVIEINDKGEAVVANPRACTMSREVFRHDDLRDLVRIERIRDHFIFSVESIGQMPAAKLVVEALKILKRKTAAVRQGLVEVRTRAEGAADSDGDGDGDEDMLNGGDAGA